MKKLCLLPFALVLFGAAPGPTDPVSNDPLRQASAASLGGADIRLAIIEEKERVAAVQREMDDLRAQQSMALSAKSLLVPSWAQVWIGLAGFAGLLTSLGFTAWSMAQTRKALSSQQNTAELQTRAYVGNDGVEILDFAVGKRPRARIKLKNFGITPAYQVKEKTRIRIIPKGGDLTFECDPMNSEVTINPTDTSVSAGYMDKLDQDQYDRFVGSGDIKESDSILVTGEVKYLSVGKVRTTRYALVFWGKDAKRHKLVTGHNWSD